MPGEHGISHKMPEEPDQEAPISLSRNFKDISSTSTGIRMALTDLHFQKEQGDGSVGKCLPLTIDDLSADRSPEPLEDQTC